MKSERLHSSNNVSPTKVCFGSDGYGFNMDTGHYSDIKSEDFPFKVSGTCLVLLSEKNSPFHFAVVEPDVLGDDQQYLQEFADKAQFDQDSYCFGKVDFYHGDKKPSFNLHSLQHKLAGKYYDESDDDFKTQMFLVSNHANITDNNFKDCLLESFNFANGHYISARNQAREQKAKSDAAGILSLEIIGGIIGGFVVIGVAACVFHCYLKPKLSACYKSGVGLFGKNQLSSQDEGKKLITDIERSVVASYGGKK